MIAALKLSCLLLRSVLALLFLPAPGAPFPTTPACFLDSSYIAETSIHGVYGYFRCVQSLALQPDVANRKGIYALLLDGLVRASSRRFGS